MRGTNSVLYPVELLVYELKVTKNLVKPFRDKRTINSKFFFKVIYSLASLTFQTIYTEVLVCYELV